MLLNESLQEYQVILASKSPRRQELLKGLELDFRVFCKDDLSETFPQELDPKLVPAYLAEKKCNAYTDCLLLPETLIITADTLVLLENQLLEKPKDLQEAKYMIRQLGGKAHEVITGVCLGNQNHRRIFSATSRVRFAALSGEEIDYYVERFQPLDKAGAYGVQEWIGYVGIESIEGSYFNVMGLPVHLLYSELKLFLEQIKHSKLPL